MVANTNQNYQELEATNHLLTFIQIIKEILIVSDWSKSLTKSEGAWLITDETGNIIIKEYNPDFGEINEINFHQSEIYDVLSVLFFLTEYCKYYSTPIESKVQEVVVKLNNISANRKTCSNNN